MKRLIYLSLIAILTTACVELDNYKEPKETLTGTIIDKNTGEGIQTEPLDNGVRIKLMEYSWSDNPNPYYFYAMMDGTYNNTKIFAGHYNIEPQGAFVPLIQKDNSGNVIVDSTLTTDVKGTVQHDFAVEPFLNIEWISEPVVSVADSSITVTVKITRGTANPSYQQRVMDINLYVNENQYVSNRDDSRDTRYSNLKSYGGNDGSNLLGQTITIKSIGKIPSGRDWYIRVGSRIDCNIAGVNRYNYSTIKKIRIQ